MIRIVTQEVTEELERALTLKTGASVAWTPETNGRLVHLSFGSERKPRFRYGLDNIARSMERSAEEAMCGVDSGADILPFPRALDPVADKIDNVLPLRKVTP